MVGNKCAWANFGDIYPSIKIDCKNIGIIIYYYFFWAFNMGIKGFVHKWILCWLQLPSPFDFFSVANWQWVSNFKQSWCYGLVITQCKVGGQKDDGYNVCQQNFIVEKVHWPQCCIVW